jgi:hypothetical protein
MVTIFVNMKQEYQVNPSGCIGRILAGVLGFCGGEILKRRITIMRFEKEETRYPNESKMNQDAVKELKKLPKTICYKRTASYNNAGQADISGCSHGFRFELEGKQPGESLEPLQSWWQREWTLADCIIGQYESPGEAVRIVVEGLEKRGVTIKWNPKS